MGGTGECSGAKKRSESRVEKSVAWNASLKLKRGKRGPEGNGVAP